MKLTLATPLATGVILFFMTGVAQSGQMNVTLTGHITNVDSELSSYFSTNENVVLAFSYDTDASPAWTASYGAGYNFGPMELTVGSHVYQAASGIFEMRNDAPYDELLMPYVDVTGLEINGLNPPEFYLGYVDYSSTYFSVVSLPAPEAFDPGNWGYQNSFVSYHDPDPNASRRVNFVFDSISIEDASVPEPSTVVLLLTGAVGLVGYRLRRRK